MTLGAIKRNDGEVMTVCPELLPPLMCQNMHKKKKVVALDPVQRMLPVTQISA